MDRIASHNPKPSVTATPSGEVGPWIASLPRDVQGYVTLAFAPPSRGRRMYAYEMTLETIREFANAARPTR